MANTPGLAGKGYAGKRPARDCVDDFDVPGKQSITNELPEYRRQGLPITSCLVESLIKEINHRVKGTEKFWNRPDAPEGESMLQTTGSLLSDGEPLTKYILSRPGSHYYRRSAADSPDNAFS